MLIQQFGTAGVLIFGLVVGLRWLANRLAEERLRVKELTDAHLITISSVTREYHVTLLSITSVVQAQTEATRELTNEIKRTAQDGARDREAILQALHGRQAHE